MNSMELVLFSGLQYIYLHLNLCLQGKRIILSASMGDLNKGLVRLHSILGFFYESGTQEISV